MKFQINRAVFTTQLNHVLKAISSRTTIPILNGIKILANEEGLWLTGSDSSISIEAFIPVEDHANGLIVSQAGSIVLTASLFSDIVRKLSAEKIQIATRDQWQVDITAGNAAFTLKAMPGSDYPKLPDIDEQQKIQLPARIFKEVVNHTAISVSFQEFQPLLTGIRFTLSKDALKAVATDSHRLSQRIVPLSQVANLREPMEMVIPGRSLNELVKIIEDEDDIEMTLSQQQVLFHTRNLYLYSRLLEGAYPNTDSLLPESYATRLVMPAFDFLRAVDRASILGREGKDHVVTLTIDDDYVLLTGQSDEIGEVKEALFPTELTGPAVKLSFNPNYMRQALKTFGEGDVVMGIEGKEKPFILKPLEHENDHTILQLITIIRTHD